MNRKVLLTRRFPESVVEKLRKRCSVDMWDSDDVIPRRELLNRANGIDGLLCLLTDQIDTEFFNFAGDQLRVVSTMSVGVDHIDLEECKSRKIKLGHTPDILTSATAELTVGLLLATTRRIVEGARAVKNGLWGSWKGMWMCGSTLEGSKVGFFGLGRIGVAVLDRLKPFGVASFVYHTPHKKDTAYEERVGATWVSFDALLCESDVVIACCELNQRTAGVFNRTTFEKMKASAIFINVSRGGVVEQDDLVEALRKREIWAAGIDVTTPEPLPTEHPLLKLDNCVVTPHIGSATVVTRTKMADLAVENLITGIEGKQMPAPFFSP